MRTVFAAVIPLTLLAAALSAPAVAQSKVAVISTPALLRDAPQVQAAGVKFKAEFQKREDELKAEGKKLDDDINRFRREADTMSPQQRTSTQNDLNTRKTNFDIKQRAFAEQAQARNNELQGDIVEKINQAIVEVAKEKGLDIVIKDPAFANESLDITSEVLKKLTAMGDKPPAADAKKKKK
jgi:outer membrane protein